MLFHRQKVLLTLLSELGGEVLATDFQKYLFLYTMICEQEKSYDFVPYKFGSFSFQASTDKNKLIEKGFLNESNSWSLSKKNRSFLKELDINQIKKIRLFAKKFESLSGKKLIQYTYRKYPYYALNSEIVNDLLDKDEIQKINNLRPDMSDKNDFATIGYEGGSIENYLNRLIENNIRLLVDVRKNPISRKYGFSKRTLSSLLNKVGIEYTHIPELGIKSSDRKPLKTQKDYDVLFDKYEKTVLKEQNSSLTKLYDLYKNNNRIAITCFEKEHCECHRSRVANAIVKMSKGEVNPLHL